MEHFGPEDQAGKETPARIGGSTGIRRIVEAFFNSLAGIRFGFLREPALRQEMLLFAASLVIAPLLTLDPWKLLLLWGALLLLLSVEFLNTGIEKLADKVTRDRDDLVRVAKDCGSAAVFMMLVLNGAIWGLALWERVFG